MHEHVGRDIVEYAWHQPEHTDRPFGWIVRVHHPELGAVLCDTRSAATQPPGEHRDTEDRSTPGQRPPPSTEGKPAEEGQHQRQTGGPCEVREAGRAHADPEPHRLSAPAQLVRSTVDLLLLRSIPHRQSGQRQDGEREKQWVREHPVAVVDNA